MPETPARHVQTSPKSIFFSPTSFAHLPPFRLASASCPVTPSSRPPINSVLVTFTLVSSVLTHGWIGSVSVSVGGAKKLFKGNEPTEELPNAASSAIRQQPPCYQVATVAAGSKLDVFWQTLTGSGFWFHDVGPMMAYMADCGGNCAQFDASKAKWFKIQEQGMDASGKWAQANLDNGSPATVTIPANLKAGNYLLRHEIIALHTAQSQGGAEFYPGCVQLSVTGAGKGVPSDSETVKLPSAYKPTDAGILIDVYNMKGAYKFPGPAVASFIGGGSPAPAQGGSDDNTTEKPSSPRHHKEEHFPSCKLYHQESFVSGFLYHECRIRGTDEIWLSFLSGETFPPPPSRGCRCPRGSPSFPGSPHASGWRCPFLLSTVLPLFHHNPRLLRPHYLRLPSPNNSRPSFT
ncbi:hypothetical protein MIND_01157500 [Mycena indigotica]|uniref:lytic cellulose monooxygenase (C4-dehydrogenating) n=1 Tax=Mycena indigotica TaxID=2126181 RepID=A0A8H6S544_9AGAR|nr:uncharacterized protein MIND_01157500 [Mycena indigotica]KAF7292597.1 hypothetical protein MIND_01157500 [Mycena indigotica]